MKTSEKMQEVITRIANKHGLDLDQVGSHLRLVMVGYDRLVIETIAPHTVSVAHYFDRAGDQIADPEIVFFTGYGDWVPAEISQVFGWQRYAIIADDCKSIAAISYRDQAELAKFSEWWAKNIKAQGWLERGRKG